MRIVEPTADHLEWCKRVKLDPPHALLMVDVTLMRASDGETRVVIDTCGYRIDEEGEDLDRVRRHVRFMWHDGNYACNCNRLLMFEHAGDDDTVTLEGDLQCGRGEFVIVAPDWLKETQT